MKTAIVTLTKGSVELGLRLHERLEGSELYVPEKHKEMVVVSHPSPATRHLSLLAIERDIVTIFDGSLKELVERIFAEYEGLVFIMAAGIVVRVIAPLVKGKDIDPAVVVMDEAGRFAVSLLSGHLGGANELAQRVAKLMAATPVITTATDVCNKPYAEGIAGELGCEIENIAGIKKVNSAFLHDERVAINLSMGNRELLCDCGTLVFFDTVEGLIASDVAVRIAVTNRLLPDLTADCLVFRPRNLVIGIGCNRNTTAEEIEEVVFKVLGDSGLSRKSIRNLATIDIKTDESGLLDFAKRHGLTIDFLTKEELDKAGLVTTPSRHVIEAVGVGGVCEPAAMRSAHVSTLLAPKMKSGNVTVAVAEA